MNYEKTALSYTEILQQLKSRGLNFQNESLALQELKSISYFRIASYLKYYESNANDHRYKEGSFFEDALYHYYFDKELRCFIPWDFLVNGGKKIYGIKTYNLQNS